MEEYDKKKYPHNYKHDHLQEWESNCAIEFSSCSISGERLHKVKYPSRSYQSICDKCGREHGDDADYSPKYIPEAFLLVFLLFRVHDLVKSKDTHENSYYNDHRYDDFLEYTNDGVSHAFSASLCSCKSGSFEMLLNRLCCILNSTVKTSR